MLDISFTSTEEGMEKLRKCVSIRNAMGGAYTGTLSMMTA